jgi:hypothetical protein
MWGTQRRPSRGVGPRVARATRQNDQAIGAGSNVKMSPARTAAHRPSGAKRLSCGETLNKAQILSIGHRAVSWRDTANTIELGEVLPGSSQSSPADAVRDQDRPARLQQS